MIKMESIVNCPECKKEVRVTLKSLEGEEMDFARGMSELLGLGIENSDRFSAEGIKCDCGKTITVSMTVTAF